MSFPSSSRLDDCGEHSLQVGVASIEGEGDPEAYETIEMDPLVFDRSKFNSGQFVNRGRVLTFSLAIDDTVFALSIYLHLWGHCTIMLEI